MPRGIAALIQGEMDKRGWSMRDVADRADVSAMTISKILRDPDRTPDLRTLEGLAGAFELPLRRLIEACGFAVDQIRPDDRARLAAVLDAVPEFQAVINPMLELDPEDRAAVIAYIEGMLASRRRR